MLLLLFVLLFQSPSSAGIELNPADPQQNNYNIILECLRTTPWSFSSTLGPKGGCRVRYTPGTYFIYKTINLPNGVTDAYFTNVILVPCAEMNSLVVMSTMGPAPGTVLHDFKYNDNKPCGTFTPPLRQPTRWQ